MSAIAEPSTESRLDPIPACLDFSRAWTNDSGMMTPSEATQSALPRIIFFPSNFPETPASPSLIDSILIGIRVLFSASCRIVLA